MKREDIVLRTVGGVAIVVAALGLWYNVVSISSVLRNPQYDPETPYFLPAYAIMSAICITCYVLLTITGIQFVRGRSALAGLFTAVLVFEVIYFFSIGMILWPMPKVGMSIAAATGVANGGLMIQAVILLPLWGPFVVNWAKRKKEVSSNKPSEATP